MMKRNILLTVAAFFSLMLPGTAPVYYRYDQGDRPVFTQDGKQRQRNEWTFTLPDAHGRTAVTGICREPLPSADTLYVTCSYTQNGPLGGYTANVALKSVTLLQVFFYDNYNFLSAEQPLSAAQLFPEDNILYDSVYVSPSSASSLPIHGLRTGSRIYRASGGTAYELTAFYYGDRNRLVQRKSTTHMNGIETEMFAYNFMGQVNRRFHSHLPQVGRTSNYICHIRRFRKHDCLSITS